MVSVGVVFSAGGAKGDPWHSGVVAAIAEATGWDASSANLLVGTSAGSFTASTLRAGLSASDADARFTNRTVTPAGQAILDRITTPYAEPIGPRPRRPSALAMSARAVWPPWEADPIRLAFGMLPAGNRSGAAMSLRIDELLEGRWPTAPMWIVAVRSNDGKRVVFGRDDVKGSPGQAVQSSSAIPTYYTPVSIGERRYIDGAVHSSTNADLVAMLGFDLVIVSSVKTATPEARSWRRDAERSWFSNKLDNEVSLIRSKGTPVVVVEPGRDELELLTSDADRARSAAAQAGRSAAERLLAGHDGEALRHILATR